MIELYGHPFAAFAWKALIAAYERDVPYVLRVPDPARPDVVARLAELSPTGQMPALVDGANAATGSNAVIAYLDRIGDAPPLIPAGRAAALRARELADIFDDYVAIPMQRVVADALRPAGSRDPFGVAEARKGLERAYAWLDRRIAAEGWAAGDGFTIADCAAAPALFYADWVHPIPRERIALAAYRVRLLARASVARVVEEARPFRHFFPLGAPDRD